MLRFDEWNKLHEFHPAVSDNSFNQETIDKTIGSVKNTLKPALGELVIIPNLEKFVREDEPVQQRTVFSTKKLDSFGINFTEDGKIHSIDFYKPDSRGSELTMYIKKGSIDKILKIIPVILPEAKPLKQKELEQIVESEQELNEEENKLEVQFKVPPSPETPAKREDLYDYGDPETIFKDLKKYVQLVIDKKSPSFVITGSPGVGKTYMVTTQLIDNGLVKGEDWVHIKGRSTPAGLYIALYENRDKILVIDDCDSVFKNEDAVNILKGALDSYEVRELNWLVGKPLQSPSTGLKIPTKFDFEGGVIFISNLPQKKIDYAIKSRSFVLEVALTPEDMIKRMESELPNIHNEVPMAIRRTALKLIESAYKSAENVELSMRSLIKSIKILDEVDDLVEAKRLILQQCSYK